MMTPTDLTVVLLSMSPDDMRLTFELLSQAFAQKAETVYEANPEEHGCLAQPYADTSSLLQKASQVFNTAGSPVSVPELEDESPISSSLLATAPSAQGPARKF